MNPHRVLLASAGTGKTYQLTGRYLQLLVGGMPPERILATTFTRKAAGEILDRVLRRLVDAADDSKRRKELNAQLGQDRTAKEYRSLLSELVRGLDRFRICTLDAFFVHLGHLYALELGLPSEWDIAEEVDDARIRRDAIGMALAASESAEWLELLRTLQRTDASKAIERVLNEAVREGRDAFLDSDAAAWDALNLPPGLDGEEVAAASSALEALSVPLTKKGTPVKNWTVSKEAALSAVAREDWEGLLEVGLVKKIIAKEDSFSRHPIDGPVLAAFQPLLDQAVHELVAEIVRRNRASHTWLTRFESAYANLKRDRRSYRFDDLPQALAPRGSDPIDEQGLDLWYRLDGRIDHLLLDEFQDTSSIQWRILEKLAEELLADGTGERSFFCVGDVKQSIYGWREAEPRLLSSMPERYPVLGEADAVSVLRKSYRSSPVVLDTVNRIFSRIGESHCFERRESYRSAAAAWQSQFVEHLAARTEKPGAAWLIEAPEPAEEEPVHLPTLKLAAERARQIHEEAPAASIGILLRQNRHLTQLIYLLRRKGLRASGEGGNALTDSAAVLHVISLLHLADHPGDTAAAFHVATSPLAHAFGWDPSDYAKRARSVSRDARLRVSAEGFGGLCAWLRPVVREHYGEWDRRRYDQLVDLAHTFDARAGTRSSDFVDYVRATPVEDPSATTIKVMTVHAAKGLEFDAVILPELNEKFFPHGLGLLKSRPDPTQMLSAVSHAARSKTCALDPDGLGRLKSEQEERGIREVLCILYVAVTRAANRLDMIVRHGGGGASYAAILREMLGGGLAGPDGILWGHPDNDEVWCDRDVEAATSDANVESASDAPVFAQARASRGLPRRSPSSQEGDGTLRGSRLLAPPRSSSRVRGLLFHRWLEEVEWLEDFEFDDAHLRSIAGPWETDPDELQQALDEFRAQLERPNLTALLSRDQHGPLGAELEVWREREFSVVLPEDDGSECLWSGAVDRVVIRRGEAGVQAVDLIDYKTDRVDEGGIEARIDFYRPQLEAYRRIVAKLCDVEPSAVRPKLFFLASDRLCEL